ncbi:MAG: hypothetical protein ACM3X6_05415 [Patescibacteria group bacterium]
MRVLVVERSPFLRFVLREVLSRANHENVGEYAGIDEAAGAAGALAPEVVLLDLDGTEPGAAAKIGELSRLMPAARLVVLGPPGRAPAGLRIDAYLGKPCTPEAVLAAIGRAALAGTPRPRALPSFCGTAHP